MPGLLIIAHAPLASSFKKVAEHVFLESMHRLAVLDVLPDMTLEVIEKQAQALLALVADPEVLMLTDILGASPCNAAQRLLSHNPSNRLLAGLNVAMLCKALSHAHEPLSMLLKRVLESGTSSIIEVHSLHQ
jgi:mannose PTS system EIIA component